MEKKRYVLFGHRNYYPDGGMDDALFSFETGEELIELSSTLSFDRYNVFDTLTFHVGNGYEALDAFNNINSTFEF